MWGNSGYGCIKVAGKRRGVHRVAWEIHNSACLLSSAVVRHSCDTRLCVNPAHLIVGSTQDNIGDRVARQRSAVHERNGRARLTLPIVREIKAALAAGVPCVTVAQRFGQPYARVYQIKMGNNWRTA